MAKSKSKGPIPLSEAELVDEIVTRLSDEEKFTKANVREVVKALKAEVADCLQNGYKVTLTGLVIFTPKVKNGKKKGAKVRNPSDGSETIIKKDQPDEFSARASVSKSVKEGFPSLKSNAGQELHKRLYVKPKPAKKG
jgi:nucleoid DNA-binding protein